MKTNRDKTKAQLLEELAALHKEVSTLREADAVHRRAVRALEETETGPLAPARDITERRDIEDGLEKTRKELEIIKQSAGEASEFAESIINTVREPLIALDHNLRVVSASRSFYEVFKVNPKETVGQLIYDLGNKQWDIPKLRELLETILPQKTTFDNYEVEHDFADIGRRIMLLNARQIQRVLGKERIILLAIEDITERKQAEEALLKAGALQSAIFSSANFSSIATDAKGVIQIFNVGAERMLGYTAAEVMNKLFLCTALNATELLRSTREDQK